MPDSVSVISNGASALDEQVNGELLSGQGNYLCSSENLPDLAQPPLFHAAQQVAQQL